MEKDITYLRQLIQTHLKSSNFSDAGKELFALIGSQTHEQDILHILEEEYAIQQDVNYDQTRWDEVFSRIEEQIGGPQKRTPRKFKLRIGFAIAAALFAISVISIIVYNISSKSAEEQLSEAIAKANIRPGRKAATLTLANGRQIALDDHGFGEIAREHGFSIQKNAEGELTYTVIKDASKNNIVGTNTLSTANGQTIKVVLPDGTKVWLNAASSITYPSSFAAAQRREVRLIGEAYFEVATDKQHPFIVTSTDQDVEVLGTHFNINGYLDKNTTYTTLLEGKIKIGHNGIFSVLNPKQQAQNTSGKFKIIDNVDVSDIVAWKDGYFVFSDSLQSIMDKVAKWYDVKVVYENEPDLTTELQGKISRQKDLNEVLQLLEKYSGGVKFQVKGKTIIVKH